MVRGETARKFPDEVDRGGIGALQIAAKSSFNNGVSANHTRAAQIAFGGKVKIAARANASAEAGRDFVIAQIDVRAATWTICRCGGLTDFVFALAFKAGDDAATLPVPDAFDLAKTSWLWCGRGLFLRVKL
jgi:hypothetical protein